MKFKNPKDKLKSILVQLMKESGCWHDCLVNEIPTTWEKYNNFIIFNDRYFQSEEWHKNGPQVWIEVCKLFSVNNVAIKGRIQGDGFRSPKVKILWGTSSLVEYTDNKIFYSWDVEQNMFSAGNASERHRVATLICKDETIVDLFAGIGYFTLPLLVHGKCEHLYACEWNPFAVTMLKRNLERNGVADRCTVLESDNREICLSNLADRVVLGLIPTSRDSWEVACRALKSDIGGVLHIHENVTSKLNESIINDSCNTCKNYFDILTEKCNSSCLTGFSFKISCGKICAIEESKKCIYKRREWLRWAIHASHSIIETLEGITFRPWRTLTLNLHHVKSYAPHIDHLVLDLECRPQS